jgi:hypothetical protein
MKKMCLSLSFLADIFAKGVDMTMYWCTTKNEDVRDAMETAINRRRRRRS